MDQRRRRRLTRNALVFLGSLALHALVFLIAVQELTPYQLPEQSSPAIQVQIVPPPDEAPPPPPTPMIRPEPQPKPTEAAQPPQPQPKPQPQTQPQQPQVQITPAPKASAPLQPKVLPTQAPSPKPALAPSVAPIAPTTPTPTPGPPKAAPHAPVAAAPKSVATSPPIVLHRNKDTGQPLVPSVSIPGAVEAPPPGGPSPGPPGGGTPGGGRPGGGVLPGGLLPGFGGGLRGGRLGCANAAAMHLSATELARCNEAFGEGTKDSPQMDPIDSSRRRELDRESTAQTNAQKYRDSTPSGSDVRPEAGQPRAGQSPNQ